jgi:hypothetical protein
MSLLIILWIYLRLSAYRLYCPPEKILRTALLKSNLTLFLAISLLHLIIVRYDKSKTTNTKTVFSTCKYNLPKISMLYQYFCFWSHYKSTFLYIIYANFVLFLKFIFIFQSKQNPHKHIIWDKIYKEIIDIYIKR